MNTFENNWHLKDCRCRAFEKRLVSRSFWILSDFIWVVMATASA